MSKNARNPAITYHDRVAHRYDDIYRGDYWEFYRAVTWECWKPFLPRDTSARMIDLGCGTGVWGLRLAKSGFNVTFLDISQKMLDVAQRKAEEMGLESRASFVRADICDLSDLDNNSFGFAVAEGDPICHAPRPNKAMKEIQRILAPGGILVASLDNKCAGIDYYLERGEIDELERFTRTGETMWLAERQEERFQVHMFSPDDARQLVEKAGLEIVALRGKTVLPIRKHADLLSDRQQFQRLLKLELKLNRNEAWLGRASHLQVVAKKME
jgi:ubiquinone/menaquinone biosynthesis C-methylase UbiE